MDWLINLISYLFTGKVKEYKERVEKLRDLLNELEKGTVSMIRVENDEELLSRAKDYISKFKGQTTYALDTSLFPAIERLIKEIDAIRATRWSKLLRHFKFKT